MIDIGLSTTNTFARQVSKELSLTTEDMLKRYDCGLMFEVNRSIILIYGYKTPSNGLTWMMKA